MNQLLQFIEIQFIDAIFDNLLILTVNKKSERYSITMNLELNPVECRVLGCMMEKSITTPGNYPLSLNSLVNACNQKSNRYPVMDLDETDVIDALDELRSQHLCFRIDVTGSRVPKFKYNIPEIWEFTGKHLAILCEMLIRGPQTPGELRTHGDRMYSFLDLNEVETTLQFLSSHEEGPFVQKLPIQPGKKKPAMPSYLEVN